MPRQGGNNRPSSSHRRALRRRLHCEQDGRCFWCEAQLTLADMQLDRVRPGKFGGTYRYDNLVGACDSCNKRRGVAEARNIRRPEAKRLWAPTIRELRQRRKAALVGA